MLILLSRQSLPRSAQFALHDDNQEETEVQDLEQPDGRNVFGFDLHEDKTHEMLESFQRAEIRGVLSLQDELQDIDSPTSASAATSSGFEKVKPACDGASSMPRLIADDFNVSQLERARRRSALRIDLGAMACVDAKQDACDHFAQFEVAIAPLVRSDSILNLTNVRLEIFAVWAPLQLCSFLLQPEPCDCECVHIAG